MDFYADLSQYYETIFPLTGSKVQFTGSYIPVGSRVLDIGCGTGELAVTLAKEGYRSCGMDLSAEMVVKARRTAEAGGFSADFRVGDMRGLSQLYEQPFDGIVCYGNTVVHLTSIQDIRDFFRQVYRLLRPKGVFLFQIVNYDRILTRGVTELPVIKDPEKQLTFYREYCYDTHVNLIHFNTRLEVKGDVIKHSVPLYPLTSGEITMILGAEGFQSYRFFGDFAKLPHDPEQSSALVGMITK